MKPDDPKDDAQFSLQFLNDTRDVCQSHHGGNAESVAAFEELTPKLRALRLRVLAAVRGLQGATVKEVVSYTGLARLTVGARLTELKHFGLLYPTKDVRDRCRVLAVTELGERTMRKLTR